MRKTNKNLTKKILTLMLAFVMVFTGMGIGNWGVDTAWADSIYTIDMAEHNTQIGTFTVNQKPYPVYEVIIDSTVYNEFQIKL